MATQTTDSTYQLLPETLLPGCKDEAKKKMGNQTLDFDSQTAGTQGYPFPEKEKSKAEIDTSVPFESVKEAVSRFGGIGFWKPHSHNLPSQPSEYDIDVVGITKLESQAAQLEKDLIVKERQTLDVLKELESTKILMEELKVKIQRESSEVDKIIKLNSADKDANHATQFAEKDSPEILFSGHQHSVGRLDLCPSSTPGFILMELKQAKLNLTRTTNDLADIRSTVESFNKKIEKERNSLEKTRQRLSSSSLKVSSLEEELNQTNQKLQLVKGVEVEGGSDNPRDISVELQRLSSEIEQFKQIGEAARSEVITAISDIEQTKSRIKTAEIRLIAAKKMKDAAMATEAVALAEMKALSKSKRSSGIFEQNPEGITLSFEEYSSLITKAREAEEVSEKKERDAMLLVDEANLSKTEILKRVEEATKEVKTSKKVLEEALNRVEAADRGKLAVEEALRKWRSDHGQKRKSVQNSTKFKNSYPSQHRRDSRLLDVNGLNLINDDSKPVLRPTLSIGQILSRKLLETEKIENGVQAEESMGKRKVSLGQMLSKSNWDIHIHPAAKSDRERGHKQLPAKRKKFGFGRISFLVTKQNKKKKKQTASSRVTVCKSVEVDQ